MQHAAEKLSRFLPTSHQGSWRGPNRLWLSQTAEPLHSPGTAEVAAECVEYTWEYKGKPQTGKIALRGQTAALAAEWVDTFHSAQPTTMHGFVDHGRIVLYGAYPAGDGSDWGWQIELDFRDPECFVLRMFNVEPVNGPVPAVILHATR